MPPISIGTDASGAQVAIRISDATIDNFLFLPAASCQGQGESTSMNVSLGCATARGLFLRATSEPDAS